MTQRGSPIRLSRSPKRGSERRVSKPGRSRTPGLNLICIPSILKTSFALSECREKNIGIGPMESTFLLTFLLIGSLRTNRRLNGHSIPRATSRLLALLVSPSAVRERIRAHPNHLWLSIEEASAPFDLHEW